MTRMRRRTKLVDALQYDGTLDGAHRLAALGAPVTRDVGGLVLTTPRGPLRIEPGDWLVRDPGTLAATVVLNEHFFGDFDHRASGRIAS